MRHLKYIRYLLKCRYHNIVVTLINLNIKIDVF